MNFIKISIFLFATGHLPLVLSDPEAFVVQQGDPIRFICNDDETIHFAEVLDDWTEIVENDENFRYFNMKINYSKKDQTMEVFVQSAQSVYFACKSPDSVDGEMKQVFHVIFSGKLCFY